MGSLDKSRAGHTADPHLPGAVGPRICGSGSSFFVGGDGGGSLGALGSPWISRLRPPPPGPRPLVLPAAAAAAAALPARGGGTVPIRNPAVDLDGRAFLGAAYKGTANGMATTRTSYDMPDTNEVQRQVVINSSFWNIERIERARVVSSFGQSLALDKRASPPDTFVPSKSQKPRTQD